MTFPLPPDGPWFNERQTDISTENTWLVKSDGDTWGNWVQEVSIVFSPSRDFLVCIMKTGVYVPRVLLVSAWRTETTSPFLCVFSWIGMKANNEKDKHSKCHLKQWMLEVFTNFSSPSVYVFHQSNSHWLNSKFFVNGFIDLRSYENNGLAWYLERHTGHKTIFHSADQVAGDSILAHERSCQLDYSHCYSFCW